MRGGGLEQGMPRLDGVTKMEEDMLIKDIKWEFYALENGGKAWMCNTYMGGFTIVDRVKAANIERDIETRFTDKNWHFYIVKGMFDIRRYHDFTLEQAAEIIKKYDGSRNAYDRLLISTEEDD